MMTDNFTLDEETLTFELDKKRYNAVVIKRLCIQFVLVLVLIYVLVNNIPFNYYFYFKWCLIVLSSLYLVFEIFLYVKKLIVKDYPCLYLSNNSMSIGLPNSKRSISYHDFSISEVKRVKGLVSLIKIKTTSNHAIDICNFENMDLLLEKLKMKVKSIE